MGKDEQVKIIKDFLLSSNYLLIFSFYRIPDTYTIQLLRKDLREYNARIYLGKNSLVSKIAQLNLSYSLYKKIKDNCNGNIGFIFADNEEYLPEINKIVCSYSYKLKAGDISQKDIWVKKGTSNLGPTELGSYRCIYMVASKISKGNVYFINDFRVVKAGKKIKEYDAIFLNKLGISTTCNLEVKSVIHLKQDYFIPQYIYTHSWDNSYLLFNKSIRNINYIKDFLNNNIRNEYYIKANKECKYNNNDFINSKTIINFQNIQQNTHCIYAKKAYLWGNIIEWNCDLSLDNNCSLIFPQFKKFLIQSEFLELDGFVLEIKGKEYYKSISIFENIYCKIIENFQYFDGIKERNETSIGYYNIMNISCFLTTFAPCYPSNHSRYMFNDSNISNSCFLLFQPESSFIRRQIINPKERLEILDNPPKICKIIRDKFTSNGRPYFFV